MFIKQLNFDSRNLKFNKDKPQKLQSRKKKEKVGGNKKFRSALHKVQNAKEPEITERLFVGVEGERKRGLNDVSQN